MKIRDYRPSCATNFLTSSSKTFRSMSSRVLISMHALLVLCLPSFLSHVMWRSNLDMIQVLDPVCAEKSQSDSYRPCDRGVRIVVFAKADDAATPHLRRLLCHVFQFLAKCKAIPPRLTSATLFSNCSTLALVALVFSSAISQPS